MKVEQIYTGCFSLGSYYIESNETHFHADFVSGYITLAEQTDASSVYDPNANPTFETILAKNGF